MFTIDEWCQKNRVSRSTFYKLKKIGKGPRLAKVLDSVRITEEADKEWIKAREADAMEAA